jgi:nucleoside-diphosphate-sugar epimerase
MPTIAPNTDALVLVSGANGYIAMHVVRVLLEKGYRVRGTVRSEAKIAHVKETFKQYGDKLEVVVVGDITVVSA